jgi:type II secretory pathway pseudopilin PulG
VTRPTPPTSPAAGRRSAAGFTLNELLIVIALAVLILALAIPAFSVITGGRSIESAENRISSYLGAVRTEAIGLQQPRGVFLFEDEGSRLITMAQVYFPPGQNVAPGGALQLDVYGAREEMSLPNGVGLQGVPNGTPVTFPWAQKYAVIMFDGDGRLLQDRYNVAAASDLGKRLTKSGDNAITLPLTNVQPNIGFALFDRPAYAQQVGTVAQKKYLDDNAVPYLVGRYNGGLLKAE